MRNSKGQFVKGTSGNKKGRPSSEAVQIRRQLAERGHEVAEQLLKQAIKGDLQACKIVLDRLCPPLKPSTLPVILPEPVPQKPRDLSLKIISEASTGAIPADVASHLVAAVGVLARIIQTDELKDRIESLESAIRGKSNAN